ncbi:conjugal transfer protein (plasmid) [Niallia sp. XMNu-256]|uniref:CD3337/EF1877 family mobilome membrane protein n=1 Tax=Niallia sp. XMNu-256 TaxID=3082444 RepID=UPI0030D278D8
MKKLMRIFLALLTLILVIKVPASAESLQDNLVPQDTETRSVGEVDLEYNEYPQHHYKLDTYVDTAGDWMPWNWADGAGKQIYIALMEVVNSIWSLNVLLANFTMLIVQEAFDLDFISGVVDQIAKAIQNVAGFGPSGFMSNGLWPLLVTFLIAIVGAWATYVGMIKRESSHAWGGLISSLVIFVFSLGFFSNADEFIGGVNKWSSNLQSDILGISASIVNPGASYNAEEGIATVRNQMFDLMVKKPYMLMQYGSTGVDEGRVNEMLSIDPILNTEERQNKAQSEVEEEDNTMMSIDGITQRASFVPLLFLANTIIGLFLLMISGSIILYQMIFLALVLFAPVPLLMALIPRWKQTAFDWLMKVIHAQLMKIAIALLLTILFGISAILYRATENSDLGYLGMMIIQIICFVGVWAKRKELFNMVTSAANNVQSSTGASLQSYQRKFRQAKSVIRNGQSIVDKTNNKGRIRNQPLANRTRMQGKIGLLNKDQLVERQKQLKATKDGLKRAVDGASLADRNSEEFHEGQEIYKNGTGVKNAAITDHEQLMDRRAEQGQVGKKSGQNVMSIEDLRRRRLETRNVLDTPLTERQILKDVDREAAASKERFDTQDVELVDRQQAERNVNLRNQQTFEDNISEKKEHQISERRTLENNMEKNISQETVNRNQTSSENNEKDIKKLTERNNHVTENYRNIQKDESHKEGITYNTTRKNEKNVIVNREKVDVSRIIENAKKNDKPLTKWEVEQIIKARKNKE